MTKVMITHAFNSAQKINMDKKSQFLYQFRAYFVNSNSIPTPFFSIPIPSPIPGIESGIEFNSHSIPELTPTLKMMIDHCALVLSGNDHDHRLCCVSKVAQQIILF